MLTWQLQSLQTDHDLRLFIATTWKPSCKVLSVNTFLGLLHWLGSSGSMPSSKKNQTQSELHEFENTIISDSVGVTPLLLLFFKFHLVAESKRHMPVCVCLAQMWCVINQSRVCHRVFLARLDPVSKACTVGITGQAVVSAGVSVAGHVSGTWDFTAALCSHRWRRLYVLFTGPGSFGKWPSWPEWSLKITRSAPLSPHCLRSSMYWVWVCRKVLAQCTPWKFYVAVYGWNRRRKNYCVTEKLPTLEETANTLTLSCRWSWWPQGLSRTRLTTTRFYSKQGQRPLSTGQVLLEAESGFSQSRTRFYLEEEDKVLPQTGLRST